MCAINGIYFGKYFRIGNCMEIRNANFLEINLAMYDNSVGIFNPVIVGENIWISNRMMAWKRAIIGSNSVRAALNVLAFGIMARAIRPIK